MVEERVAVVGAGCRFPGAPDLAAFWRNLRAGADTLTRFDTAGLVAAGLSPELVARPEYVPVRGTIPGGELFDWEYFAYSRAEAALIDPQQRVFLAVCAAALQDAALEPGRFAGWVGVFAGCDTTTAPLEPDEPDALSRLVGREKDFLATRVAYKLGLRGPAVTVQTACSTSLVAVHQAALSLLHHECDAALAGGAGLWLPQTSGYLYQDGHILSVDGACRPFDADSSGTVPSNGAGAVVLRRLSDALTDGDRVMAVLRGSALNNDGGEKIGYTAPSMTGQRDVIRLALGNAGVDPADVRHVEAHGTATQVGDPVEVAALTAAYRAATDGIGYCWLGAVKSNIGHTGAAAGVAGLIKTALMLEHREWVPTAHFRRANPELELESSPFRVITGREPVEPGSPALAAVSAFGIGGTNAHAVLEGPPEPVRGDGPRVFCLSAPTADALRLARTELADRLAGEDPPDPVSAAWTLLRGRPLLAHRVSVVAEDLGRAGTDLRDGRPGAPARGTPARVAFVFPGQGALYPGAAAAAYQCLPVFREVFDEANALSVRTWGVDLGAAVRPDADPSALRDGLVAQIGLFAVGYGLGAQLLELGVRPVAVMGHSAGEYVAAALAGVWDLPTGLTLVAERAIGMAQGPPGRLLAVSAPPAEVEPLLAGRDLGVATDGPGRTVVSGSAAAVARLAADLAAEGIHHDLVDVFVPAHTDGMRPVGAALRAAHGRVAHGVAELPVISNLTGGVADAARLRDPEYWVDQMCCRVRLGDGMAALLAEGADVVVEAGPGQTVTAGMPQLPGWTTAHAAVPLLGRAGVPRREALFGALGRLWEAGLPVDLAALFGSRPSPCSLPPVPLRPRPCPVPQDAPAPAAARVRALTASLAFPADGQRRLSDRPDLSAALHDYAAGLGADFVLASTGLTGGASVTRDALVAELDPRRRLPDMAGFLVSTLVEQGWLTGTGERLTLVEDVAERVGAALARAGELDELDGVRRLLAHTVGSYADVFAGRTEPLEVLYPYGTDERLRAYLAANEVAVGDAEPCLRAAAEALAAWYGSRAGVRVVEVGAGSGELTWRLLDAWPPGARLSYDATDISTALVAELERTAARRGATSVRGRVFDMRADPVEQGMTPGGYDLVVAYNAVHVAPSVTEVLRNLATLMRPDGVLCLVELTGASRWTTLVWGLAPGWWDFAGEGRTGSPTLDVPAWRQAFTEAGFASVAAAPSDSADHAVLVAAVADPVPASAAVSAVRARPVPAPLAGDGSLPAVLAGLWHRSLGVTAAAPEDDFYLLGGESLGLVHLLGQVRRSTGITVAMTEFAASPTFGALLDLVGGRAGERADTRSPNLLTLNAPGVAGGLPLFLTAPASGSTSCYRHLATLLGERPVFGLETPGLHDGAPAPRRFEDLARANLELLRSVRPHGPYRLGGWSAGAMIAQEMAAQLRDSGERVEPLLLIDGYLPWTRGLPVASRPGFLARGLWYRAKAALPRGRADLAAPLGRSYHASIEAMLRYVPRQVDCGAVLFKTGLTERRRRRVLRAMAASFLGGVRAVAVPGDHSSLLDRPHVGVVAERIRAELDGG